MTVLASVLDIIMWLIFNIEYRAEVFSDRTYPFRAEFIIDFAITFLEAGFMIIVGFISGKVIASYMNKFGKYYLPLVIASVFLLLFILSTGGSYLYVATGYYRNLDFTTSSFILGSLSSLFTLIMLSDDLIDTVRNIDISRKQIEDLYIKAKSMLAQAELEKNNVLADNHFLFNCMGLVYSEIEENPQEAAKTMENLLGVTRYMSYSTNVSVVSLQEELEFLEWYLLLVSKRHPYVNVDISGLNPDIKGYVVPISIQGLVHNAIKHNTHSSCNPLNIYIYEEKFRITVRNMIQPLVSSRETTGCGLELLKARYRDLTDEPKMKTNLW